MDKFAIKSASQRIEYWLKIDPEPFSKLKEQISDLQNALEKTLDLFEDGDCRTTSEEADEIKSVANDVEDVFDTFIYNFRSVHNSYGVAKISATILNNLSLNILRNKIESIQHRLLVMLEGKKRVGFVCSQLSSYTGQSNYADEEYIVGLEADVENMIPELISKDLLFIVGCHGAGKTTLARQIYTNSLVREYFDNFIWFSQSADPKYLHPFLTFKRKIFEYLAGFVFGDITEEIWTEVIGKCLIILDEVSCSMTENVNELLQTFPTGFNGMKIIITGSNEEYDIFKNDSRCYFHQVKGKINEEQGWDLLCHLAFDKQTTTIPEMLAKKMLQICKGQPFTIKLLSGVLSAKGMVDDVKDVYELSYMTLDYNLKACFLYLGVFPYKYEIHAGVYQRMWIAEGFGGNDSEEDVMEYLEELSRRYLIRILERNLEGRIKIFQVPSLIYQFCITKAQEENFLDIDSQQFNATSFNSQNITSRSRWCKKSEDSYIRSLSLFHCGAIDNRIRIGSAIYKNLKLLRVLTLWGIFTSGKSLPDEIGLLVHLTYLGIRNTNIDILPDSIGNLKKLLTLDWRSVYRDISRRHWRNLPYGICKMVQLRHLYLHNRHRMNSFKLFNLNNLYTLWGIGLGKCLVEGGKLWNFPNLRQLYLYDIYLIDQLDTIFECFKTTPNLRKLKLNWRRGYLSSKIKLQSIDQLYEHCRKLCVLKLIGRFEKYVALQFPPNLIKLELVETKIKGYDPLVLIGNCCPNLKVLKLRNQAFKATTMRCRAAAFQSLVELVVDDMDELETWVIETGALPRLEKLILSRTNKLARLPEGIRYITTLAEFILENMTRKFCEKLVRMEQKHLATVNDKIKGEDFYIIQHIPNIKFINIFG